VNNIFRYLIKSILYSGGFTVEKKSIVVEIARRMEMRVENSDKIIC
jgi:hypothetical protein